MEKKLCKCGCGEELKNQKGTYIRGHSNRDPEIKAKKLAVCLEKYGVSNPSQLKEVKLKREQTNIEKFGTKHAAQNKTIQEKVKQNWLEKFGTDNPSKLKEVKDIISEKVKKSKLYVTEQTKENLRKTFFGKINTIERLGNFKALFSEEDYKGVEHIYSFECLKCYHLCESHLNNGKTPRCYYCNPLIQTKGQSLIECELVKWLKTKCKNVLEQDRKIINPLELDIVLPDHKLGIELNGLYWHSEISGKKSRFYHHYKMKKAQEAGYQLLQIMEDEWVFKQNIVKSRLKHAVGKIKYKIYARKCKVRQIPASLKSKFLQKYHIQGNDNSTIYLGLFYKNHLVSVMTFSPLRKALGFKSIDNNWELVRFCSVFQFSVVGGASKLLKYFETHFNPAKLLSYADRRWSEGNLYKQIGFKLIGETVPNYWYVKNGQRKHRFGFQKNKLSTLLNIFNETLSEWENMQLNGYDRVWDCGSLKFEKAY